MSRSDYTLSIIIPAFDEAGTIEEIVRRVRAVEIPKEIVIVEDASRDGTREILQEKIEKRFPDVKVCYHDRNRGKGAAIRSGIALCTGDYILIQDADLEYNPKEYPTLLEPLLDGRADVVYGSRFIGGGAHRVHLFWHRIANSVLTTFSNMMTNLNLTDMEVCYKVFRAEVIKDIEIKSDRFDFEPEITAKIARRRCRVYEVPVSYSGRDYSEGKKIGWRDAVAALWTIFKYRFVD